MRTVKLITLIGLTLLLFSCAPVLNRDLMHEGSRDVSFRALREHPDQYKGRLFIFGGVIVQTKLTEQGSQIEAMHVPVDKYGHFRESGMSEGRYLAFMPSDVRMLDPEVFAKGRRVTMAAEFTGVQKARIDEMNYVYPVFTIRQIYLWPRERDYYPGYYYDPWFYPYPYYYWDPWWSSPFYFGYYPDYYYGGGPVYRTPPSQPSPPPSFPHRFEGGGTGQPPAPTPSPAPAPQGPVRR